MRIATWQHPHVKIETMGDRLQSALDDAGILKAELARRSGVDPPAITRIIKNERGTGVENLQAIADALDIELRWLVTGEGDRRRRPTPGRSALDEVLRTMVWPEPINIEAADAATTAARREAELPAGRERAASVWSARLLQFYREASTFPESLAKPLESSPPAPPEETPPPLRSSRKSIRRRA